MAVTLPGPASGWPIHAMVRIAAVAAGLLLSSAMEAPGEEGPIPQDTARMEKRRREQLEWNVRTTRGAYDKVGKKDLRWDNQAHEALDLAARMFSGQVDPLIVMSDLYKPAKAARDAGCDDPYVYYLYSRALVGPHFPGRAEYFRVRKDAATALAASQYPVFRRAVALERAGNDTLNVNDEASRQEAEQSFDRVLALLPESVANDERSEFWADAWDSVFLNLVRGYRALGVDAEKAYERVDSRLAQSPELKALRLQLRGVFYLGYGWEARTKAFAPMVPRDAAETFAKRVEIARKALEEAWTLRPDSRTASHLVDIDKSIGGDRATMELWFDRAMKADGNNRNACWAKLDWLDPKWHGDERGEADARVRQGLPRHEELAHRDHPARRRRHWRHAAELPGKGQVEYLGLPEVWKDIQPAYDEYLKHYPDDDVARSKFATFGYLCNHFPEAHAQYEILGDRLTQWSEFPYVPLEQMKQNRSDVAEYVSETRKVGWHRLVIENDDSRWKADAPVATEKKEEAGLLGAPRRNVWTGTAAGVVYTVRVQPIPPALATQEPTAALDAMRVAVAGERGGKARNEHGASSTITPRKNS